jgi:predicted MPP superfamily phosphohydrolase
VLPRTSAQLTLSGHTHGGQLNIAGISPAAITYNEYDGMYNDESGRALFVTTGIGGFVPFRIGIKPEVVVITLHRKN